MIMCLTIPAKVISIKNNAAVVKVDDNQQTASMEICRAKKGDYVIVQNGFITKKINPKQAKKTLQFLEKGGI